MRKSPFLLFLFAVSLLGFTQQPSSGADQPELASVPKTEAQPLPQAPDLKLLVESQDGRSDYRLGEIVNLKLGYASSTVGRYVHFEPAYRHPGGRGWSIQCEPVDSVVDRKKESGRLSSQAMLHSGPGCGFGSGGGGGDCGDCTFDLPVTEKPTQWLPFILNDQVELTRPGHYSCTARTADVGLATPSSETFPVFELTSAPLKFNIYNDVQWSRSALDAALLQLRSNGCSESSSDDRQCWDSAQAIRFLGTEDSLRAAVRLFQGTDTSYSQGQMWLAILQTRHRKLAIELLSQRLLDGDFVVTENFLDTLVAMALREESPGAFAVDAEPADYHQRAIELLRTYVRELGNGLNKKHGSAIDISASTYKRYASEMFCDSEPLIPLSEVENVLAAIER